MANFNLKIQEYARRRYMNTKTLVERSGLSLNC